MTGYFPIDSKLSIFNVMDSIFYEYETEIINSGIENGSILALI